MMNSYKLIFIVLFLSIFLTTSCNDDDVSTPNDGEVINNVEFTLSNNAGDSVSFLWVDPDGDGGMAPEITGNTLQANTIYTGTVSFQNTLVSPSENVTEEVIEEADEHQVFYTASNLDITIAYADMDANSNPIGIETAVTTGAAGTGELTIVLRHEPAKDAENVAAGDITNAGGETDVEITFPVVIQ